MAKARDFPGTAGANISITDPAGILVNAAWTCLMWVNPATLAADGAIIVRVGSVNATTRGVGLGTQAAGRLRIDSGAQAVAGAVGSPLVVSTWQRIGYRKAAAGVSQMLVTLNGVDVGSEATDAPPALATGDVFQVSDATASYGRANFDGQVAFLAWVQGVALSAAQQDAYLQDPEQLVTDYGPLGAVTPDALKVYWPMQCDTVTEEDESGVGNNGTRNGAVPLVLTGPTPTTAWDPCAAAGPTIDTQPVADTGLINGDAARRTTVYTVEASSVAVGGVTGIVWNEDDTPISDGGVYDIQTTGLGTASVSSTLTITRTVKTGTPFVIDADVTDADGTTASGAVNDTWYTGPVLSKSSGTTNASGVDTLTITSDYPNADGEFTVVTATAGGVTKQVALHYETPP